MTPRPHSLYGDEGEGEEITLTGESLPVGAYTLKATAYSEAGEALGILEVSFTVEQPLPGRPQDLRGEASAQGIALTWTAPEGSAVTQYVVYRGKLENGSMQGQPMTEYATIDATGQEMSYTDANVEADAEYRYRGGGGQLQRGGQEVHLARYNGGRTFIVATMDRRDPLRGAAPSPSSGAPA